MLKIVPSNQFKKDLKLARKRGCKIERLRDVVNALANEQKLDERYRDHGLAGNYSGFRECHIEPDWLLIYRINQNALELFLFRTGTQSDLL
ncbi:MAG: type II toxin-antitoxin system YafQ family toxin [Roseburia sp.]|nr:type II toxin-antitoxin system YafQ family toxin [Roseburia sp.]MCM1099339.1 type II toxin-antitoxin system YafQ family toxin [Ruminococcus flavefaciens]